MKTPEEIAESIIRKHANSQINLIGLKETIKQALDNERQRIQKLEEALMKITGEIECIPMCDPLVVAIEALNPNEQR